MKVIDLLNKIANCEEVPKKIRITDVDIDFLLDKMQELEGSDSNEI